MNLTQWLKTSSMSLDTGVQHKKGKVLKRFKKVLQKQQAGYWCWSATAVSVNHYYNPNSTITQCQVASTVLYPDENCDCCLPENQKNKKICNKPARLSQALKAVANYVQGHNGSKQPNFKEIREQIDQERPLCMAVRWNCTGNHHFLALSGYGFGANNQPMLVIADVARATVCLIPKDKFPAQYSSGGSWSWSYWTTPSPATPNREG